MDDIPQNMNWKQMAKDIDCAAIIISACRRSGKTFLTRQIMYEIGKVHKPDLVILFSETADFNDDFDYISPYYKYNRYDEDVLAGIIEQQEKTMKIFRQQKKRNKNFNKTPAKIYIIFDDVAHDHTLFYSEAISKLFVLGRHINIGVVYLTQHLASISPKQKKNADIMITFRDPDIDNRKLLQNKFMTLTSLDRKNIPGYMDQCFDEPYKCICICVYKIQNADMLSDFIYTYKAPKNKPSFKLGQKQFWDKNMSLNMKQETIAGMGVKVSEKDIKSAFSKKRK